ncbi:MAG: DNA cytosine methyltransferase [Elioraea sp.]|nr:DNA cytosine methyltransferase [Elioraea sp.]
MNNPKERLQGRGPRCGGKLESSEILTSKLARLASGAKPRVLDLFSGCGGISLGFKAAGFRIEAAVEADPIAARSHARNFHPNDFERHAVARDVTKTIPEALCRDLGLGEVTEAIDVIVGGPPCQAYARVGRAKLREVAAHPEAFKVDPRGNLYLRYLDYVRAFEPLALLMENVPDVMSYGGHNVAQEMVETLDALGYVARYSLINAVFHGVPQMRDRVYLIAYRRELGLIPEFPEPSHHIVLPSGYAGQRNVALKLVDLLGCAGYVQSPASEPGLPAAVSAQDAIGDLPPIDGTSVTRGVRRLDGSHSVQYRATPKISGYAAAMRKWPGFEGGAVLVDHVIRSLPRDGRIFAAMPEGAEYPAAHALALRMFEAEAAARGLRRGTRAWEALMSEMVPPYDPSKFPNRWWKLRREQPVRTLMAHLGKDSYSHIHYDDAQARTISVREAARLQSFPDGFRFEGTMNSAFRQIGNAVPPLMAERLARCMAAALRRAVRGRPA